MNLYILLIVEYIFTIINYMEYGYNYNRFILGLLNYNIFLYLCLIIFVCVGYYILNNYTLYLHNKSTTIALKAYKTILIITIIINIFTVIK